HMIQDKKVKITGPGPYGLRIKGGIEFNHPIMVTQVTPKGKAQLTGITQGMIIQSINGINFQKLTHSEAVSIIKNSAILNILLSNESINNKESPNNNPKERDIEIDPHTEPQSFSFFFIFIDNNNHAIENISQGNIKPISQKTNSPPVINDSVILKKQISGNNIDPLSKTDLVNKNSCLVYNHSSSSSNKIPSSFSDKSISSFKSSIPNSPNNLLEQTSCCCMLDSESEHENGTRTNHSSVTDAYNYSVNSKRMKILKNLSDDVKLENLRKSQGQNNIMAECLTLEGPSNTDKFKNVFEEQKCESTDNYTREKYNQKMNGFKNENISQSYSLNNRGSNGRIECFNKNVISSSENSSKISSKKDKNFDSVSSDKSHGPINNITKFTYLENNSKKGVDLSQQNMTKKDFGLNCISDKNNKVYPDSHQSSNSINSIEAIKNKIKNFVKIKTSKKQKNFKDPMQKCNEDIKDSFPSNSRLSQTVEVKMDDLDDDDSEYYSDPARVFLSNSEILPDLINLENDQSESDLNLDGFKNINGMSMEMEKFLPCFATIIKDFDGKYPKELTVYKGTLVHVLRRINISWVEAEFKGVIGLLPISHIFMSKNNNEGKIEFSKEIIGIVIIKFGMCLIIKDDYMLINTIIDDNWFEATMNNARGIVFRNNIHLLEGVYESLLERNKNIVTIDNILHPGDCQAKNLEKSNIVSGDITKEEIMFECEANQNYSPAYQDEISMEKGDKILVQKFFTDGWANGYNKRSTEWCAKILIRYWRCFALD
ncbi:hypothetical protein HZS_4438, partial [Henneguya salminicola]